MQDGSIGGEEASVWLKQHFASDPEPSLNLSWGEGDPEQGSYERLLYILFAPRPGDLAA
jgi:hypothetical protein